MLVTLAILMVMPMTFAAWWGTPGYEWCLSQGITSVMSQSELNKPVTNERFYDILLKYLRTQNISKHSAINRSFEGYTENINPIFSGMATEINKYLDKTSLTPQEYKQVISYIDHAESNISTHLSLLNRSDAKDFFLYLSLARYRAATLIGYTTDYRRTEMAKYNNVKYKDIFLYGLKPYFGKITRKEFLVLMFTLLAPPSKVSEYSDEGIIDLFNSSGVLLGWDDDLWLNERITYAEMFTFLNRFDWFDFTFPTETSETDQ